FTRYGNLSGPLDVAFSVGGIGTLGADYTVSGANNWSAQSGSVRFGEGVVVVDVTIMPIDDTLIELNENIVVTLQSGPDYVRGDAVQATAVIISNEFGGDFGDAP